MRPAAAPLPSERELSRARRLLAEHCGLRFRTENRTILEEGLARAAAAEGRSLAQLLDGLEAGPSDGQLQSIVREVTIGETFFFRHPEHFAFLREVVIPELQRTRPESATIRAWSAGCATGEEAWSLAMALAPLAGPVPASGRTVQVLGTDINRAALETARRGHYGRWSLRGLDEVPAGLLDRAPDGGARVGARLREQVRFEYLNLHDPSYPSLYTGTQGVDLIFCRNVLLYFSPEAAAHAIERLQRCLVPGGFLILSALDVCEVPAGLEPVHHRGMTAWRRTARETVEPQADPRATPTRPEPEAPPAPASSPALRDAAKAVADRGDLARAVELARAAVAVDRSPEALHLLALVLGERGEHGEAERLLREAVTARPDYVLGHLSLGLLDRDDQPSSGARHLATVLRLLGGRSDDEILPGPDPLSVSWVRTVAEAALTGKAAAPR